ncbi:RAD55 family ATPase [Natronomonas sp. EA1]|uniref:RAD55 family ATPase n=1 Tax=Natronomonas sp. EA1 TaxID=3421655 RepID=UPI003EBA6ABD
MELVETGVEGLDAILNGGIARRAAVLVSGRPGTGKSILGLQYLYNGVEQFDERGIYLSFEESERDIREAAESIGFENWAEHVENGDITVFDKRQLLQEDEFAGTLDTLMAELDGGDYDRLVLDSLTMFGLFFDTEREKRTYLLKFVDVLKEFGLTSLLVAEQSEAFPTAGGVSLENFLTDGNIFMLQTPTEAGVNRYLWVSKMRKQEIQTDIFPMEITQGGIAVYERAAGFSLIGGNPIT